MKKVKVIEEGVLNNSELRNVKGGVTNCKNGYYYTCSPKYKKKPECKCPFYQSCSPSSYIHCWPYSSKLPGPGGLTSSEYTEEIE